MEILLIYLHRNVNNSKFIKKKFPPEIRPALIDYNNELINLMNILGT